MSKFDDVLKEFSLTEESFTDSELKEMGTNDAKSMKDDEEWVKVLQTGSYLQFKNREDTQLNSSQYKKYRKAAMIELVNAGVLDKSFIKESHRTLPDVIKAGSEFEEADGYKIKVSSIKITSVNGLHPSVQVEYTYTSPTGKSGKEEVGLDNFIANIKNKNGMGEK